MAAVAGLRVGGILQGFRGNLPGRLDGDLMKQDRVQLLVGDLLAHAPQGLVTQILGGIALLGDIEGLVPLLMEGQLLDRLGIGEVVHLLQHQDTQDGVQLFRGAAQIRPEPGGDLVHRQFRQDFLAEQAGPGVFQKLAPLGA